MSEHPAFEPSPNREEFLRRLNDTTHFIRPKHPINASTVTNKRLIKLGLPPRPNKRVDPLGWELWWEFFSPEVEFLKGEFTLSAIATKLRHYRETRQVFSSHDETSANWSGAYITPDHGRRFKDIHGRWRVPAVKPPTQGPLDPSGVYHSSVFIGLDGQRRYAADSLPQIGTRQEIDAAGAGTRYETWWEWFARGDGSWPTQMPLQVKAGQRVKCWITVISPTKVRFMMRNLETRFAIAFHHSPPLPADPALFPGVTAEWVVERPTDKFGVLATLPDYCHVSFHQCIATADGATGGPKYHDLTGARLIRMMERRYSPWRAKLISEPRRIPNPPFVEKKSFRVDYRSGT